MNSLPTIIVELRAATAAPHRRLDARLPFSSIDLVFYRNPMSAYFGFYQPLERAEADSVSCVSSSGWTAVERSDERL